MSMWMRRWDGAELWGVALFAAFVFAASCAPLAVSMAVSPEQIELGDVTLSPPCPVRAQTGADCPTCGLTRGFTAMSRLRFGDAQDYNRTAPWLYIACWACTLASAWVIGRVAIEGATRRRRASTAARPLSV